jgi:nitric oxide synthase oxygenase domain/subunit
MKPIIKQIALEAGGSHYPVVGGRLLEHSIEIAVRQCAAIALEHQQYNVAKEILQKFELYDDQIYHTTKTN